MLTSLNAFCCLPHALDYHIYLMYSYIAELKIGLYEMWWFISVPQIRVVEYIQI